jgi:hypothetical protein
LSGEHLKRVGARDGVSFEWLGGVNMHPHPRFDLFEIARSQ